jgi:hypothetical protein
MQGGGGGGWGATGGISYLGTNPQNDGSPGGNSIITNGNAITTITAGTQYGALRTTGTTYVQTLSSSATTTTVTIPSGYTNAIIFIPTGVTLRSAVQATAALIVTGALVDNLKIIVNGAVLGKGGNGASESNNPQNGGDAIRIAPFKVNITITIDCTYGYVAAGGGGGGRAIYTVANTYYLYGGGGAGSGNSGEVGTAVNPALGATSVGTSGSNGTTVIDAGLSEYTSGGGGGLIVPGTSVSLGSQTAIGAYPGIGGSGGGTGAARKNSGVSTNFTNNGGGFNQLGGTLPTGANRAAGGGGGGWGAGGGRGVSQFASQQSGGLGGYAVNYGIGGFAIYVINPANVAGQLI